MEVRDKALEHWRILEEIGNLNNVSQNQEMLTRKHSLEKWLVGDAFELLKAHFKPYLRFTEADLEIEARKVIP